MTTLLYVLAGLGGYALAVALLLAFVHGGTHGDPPAPPAKLHGHDQTPREPRDGQRFTCSCGYAAEYVDPGDGEEGEWVTVSAS